MIHDIHHLAGKVLTQIVVFDTWRQASGPSSHLPLFGAVALCFGDDVLLLESPLRYRRSGRGTSITLAGGEEIVLGYRADWLDGERFAWQQECLRTLYPYPLAGSWQSTPFHPAYGQLHNSQDLVRILGKAVTSATWITSAEEVCPFLSLSFSGAPGELWLTYRDDLDGAIQLARPGWRYDLKLIQPATITEAFGWLRDDFPVALVIDQQTWNSVEHYATSLAAHRLARDMAGTAAACTAIRSSTWLASATTTLRAKAREMKWAQFPTLGRRYRAIRYPVLI